MCGVRKKMSGPSSSCSSSVLPNSLGLVSFDTSTQNTATTQVKKSNSSNFSSLHIRLNTPSDPKDALVAKVFTITLTGNSHFRDFMRSDDPDHDHVKFSFSENPYDHTHLEVQRSFISAGASSESTTFCLRNCNVTNGGFFRTVLLIKGVNPDGSVDFEAIIENRNDDGQQPTQHLVRTDQCTFNQRSQETSLRVISLTPFRLGEDTFVDD